MPNLAEQGNLSTGHVEQLNPPIEPFLNGRSGSYQSQQLPQDAPAPGELPEPKYPNGNSLSLNSRPWPPYEVFDRQRNNLQHNLELNPSGERLGFNFLLDATQNGLKNKSHQASQHSRPNLPNSGYADDSNPNIDPPVAPWAAPCRSIAATCPLDGIILDFVSSRQREAADGVPKSSLVGPAYPSVSSLLNPEHSRHSHPLSQVLVDILGNFPHIYALPEKVAVLYM